MHLTTLFLNIFFLVTSPNDDFNKLQEYNETVHFDTIFNGRIYWDLHCNLFPEASYPILDSIIAISKKTSFETCKITVIESVLPTESKSCASAKAYQIELYFEKFHLMDKFVISNGRKVITEDTQNTIVIIEVY